MPLHRALAERASPTRGGIRRPVPLRHRHRADDLRRASASSRRTSYRGVDAAAGHRHVDALHVRPTPAEPSRKTRAVLRDDGPPRHLRRRLEGRDPPRRGRRRSTTTSGSCTTSPSDFSECHDLAAEQPDKLAELVERVVAARPRSTACCRSTTASSSCSARASRTAPPTRRTGATPTGRRCRRFPRRPRPRSAGAAGTWPRRSTAPRGDEGVLYAIGTENAGFSSSSRTSAWCSTTTRSATTRSSISDREVPGRRVAGRGAGAPDRAGGTAPCSCSSTTSRAAPPSSRCS